MMDAAQYSASERLRDGRRIEIRALKPEDRAGLHAAVERMSTESLYTRFFGVRRNFSEKEVAFFLNVDFTSHVALVAVAEENGQAAIVGGARYIVVRDGSAEVAFVVIDAYQGKGIGTLLMRHLIGIARDAGLKEFIAEVLPENGSMLGVFRRSGLSLTTTREADALHVVLDLS